MDSAPPLVSTTSPLALGLTLLLVVIPSAIVLTGGIRKNIFRLLGLYKRGRQIYLRLTGGRTEESELERRVISGKVWEEWCDSLKTANAALVAPGCPQDAFNQAEGYRYLTRLVRASLENFLECNDPSAPVLVSLANGLRDCPVKLGADNPDNLYQNANLDSRETYLVKGKRGTVNYLGFGTQSGTYGQAGGLQTVMYRDFPEFKHVNEDGSFEIVLSADETGHEGKNWLKLLQPPHRAMFIVRQTFLDRKTEIPAEFTLTRISGPHKPSQLTCAQIEEALQTSAMFVCGASMMFSRWSYGFQQHVNTLPLFDQETSNKAGGDPHIRYYHSYWQLKHADECLVLTSKPPQCEHWNFQLNNHWMESLDYRYYQVHVNSFLAKYDSNGGVRVIISAVDPKLVVTPDQLARIEPYYWIDTCGHLQGQMLWRWVKVKCSDDQLPGINCQVVNLKDL